MHDGPRGLLGRIALAYSPDGAMLVASGPGGAINLWDAETGKLLRVLARTPSPAIDAALSPDGSLLAVACEDGATMLLNMSTGSTVRTFKGHAAGVNAVAISSDGKRLATASEDQKIKIWEVATGTLLQTLGGHATGVKGVAFAPDGRSLASVGGQYRGTPVSEVFVWDLASGSLVAPTRWAHQPGDRRGLLSRRPPPGHRQRRSNHQALGSRHRRRCFHAQGAHQRRRQPGDQPRRPADRLRRHRLHGPHLECRAAHDPRRSSSPPGRGRARSNVSSALTCSNQRSLKPSGPTPRSTSLAEPPPWRLPAARAKTPSRCTKRPG